jgi:O-methyltransferase
MSLVQRAAQKIVAEAITARKLAKAIRVYKRYRTYTMIPPYVFESNLLLCEEKAPETGCIVEAGVWRGGMSAGIADMLPGRVHYLFDSFEGLPPAEEIDGEAALKWQQNVTGPTYYDNCRADRSFAEEAMAIARAKKVHIVQGWFSETVLGFVPSEPIAILRLDGDWYESTMQCLSGFYPYVMQGGLIILDDYYAWDGCAHALHDYLSAHKCADRIEKWRGVCYLTKRSAAKS